MEISAALWVLWLGKDSAACLRWDLYQLCFLWVKKCDAVYRHVTGMLAADWWTASLPLPGVIMKWNSAYEGKVLSHYRSAFSHGASLARHIQSRTCHVQCQHIITLQTRYRLSSVRLTWALTAQLATVSSNKPTVDNAWNQTDISQNNQYAISNLTPLLFALKSTVSVLCI